MAGEAKKWPTLRQRVLAMSEEEVVAFARARAMEEADSSAFEGIPLDENSLNRRFLRLYRRWRQEGAGSCPVGPVDGFQG